MKIAHNRVDMVGKIYNRWKVLDHAHTRGKVAYYTCKCLGCDNIFTVSGINIRSGASKNCVNCGLKEGHNKQRGSYRSKFTIEERRYMYLHKDKRKSAKSRRIPFELNIEAFKLLVKGDCYFCGSPPNTTVNVFLNSDLSQQTVDQGFITYNGIDRLDSSKGYVSDNCVSCCIDCNTAKMQMSETQFYTWIKRVYDYIKLKNRL